MSDRLDPYKLLDDAAKLLEHTDPQRLVADLLRTIRKQDDQLNAMREDHSRPEKEAWARADAAEQERNEYREVLRIIKRATRELRLGRGL
jgi:hypothetical protein